MKFMGRIKYAYYLIFHNGKIPSRLVFEHYFENEKELKDFCNNQERYK